MLAAYSIAVQFIGTRDSNTSSNTYSALAGAVTKLLNLEHIAMLAYIATCLSCLCGSKHRSKPLLRVRGHGMEFLQDVVPLEQYKLLSRTHDVFFLIVLHPAQITALFGLCSST